MFSMEDVFNTKVDVFSMESMVFDFVCTVDFHM